LTLRLGTRGSTLALAQARLVAERLPGEVELVPIRTAGDGGRSGRAAQRGGDKSRFVKELEDALLSGRIDLAVHSAKDVPSELLDGLAIAGVPERADPRDALCGAPSLGQLPERASVGTSSLRRRAQLLAIRPDLQVSDLRGNVDTRLRRLEEGAYDVLVLAAAGLARLGRSAEGAPIAVSEMIPAPGQGALAVEVRAGHDDLIRALSLVDHPPTRAAVVAERAVLRELGGGCMLPVATLGTVEGARLVVRARVTSPDGREQVEASGRGDPARAFDVGAGVGRRLLELGAADLLAERSPSPSGPGA
jgi:hydroxymethylbilane synthase